MSGVIRLGVLRLADSAPALVALERGLFTQAGLEAQISLEPSWANIADKLTWGLLDGAIMLPPLAIAMALGLRGKKADLLLPLTLSHGGNTLTLAAGLAGAVGAPGGSVAAAARHFTGWLRAQPTPPRLAVVHAFSTHNLLLRHFVASGGGVPDADYETVALPPEQVMQALAQGQIAGFCAGAPWGEEAVITGVGRLLGGSSWLAPGHPEKCLAVRAGWAEGGGLPGLVAALQQARAICASREEADWVAGVLGRAGMPETACRAVLPGGSGGGEQLDFTGPDAPDAAHLGWCLQQMQRWGWVTADASLPESLCFSP